MIHIDTVFFDKYEYTVPAARPYEVMVLGIVPKSKEGFIVLGAEYWESRHHDPVITYCTTRDLFNSDWKWEIVTLSQAARLAS